MAAVTTAVAAVAGVAVAANASSKANKAQNRALDQQQAAADRQADIADRQMAMAEEDRARYKEKFQPIEDEVLERNLDYGSVANQNKAAQDAAAAVSGSFASARDRLNKTLGVNPNSQAYLQEVNRINLTEAANSAAAQTGARRGVVDKGMALTADAINIGRGLPSQSAAQLSGAAATYGATAGLYGQRASMAGQQAQNTMNTVGGIGRTIGGLYQGGAFDRIGSAARNWLGKTEFGSSGFGTGLAYGNQDIGGYI